MRILKYEYKDLKVNVYLPSFQSSWKSVYPI